MTDDFTVASKFRTLTGPARAMERTLVCLLTVVGTLWAAEVQNFIQIAVFKEQYLGLFLALALGAVFLAVKARPRDVATRVPWYDWILAFLGVVVGGYVVIMYPTIAYRLGILTWDKVTFGAVAVLIVLEATRRLVGWALVWVAVACILYAKFAYLLPGLFYAKGTSWPRLASYLYLDSNGLFGIALGVAGSIVVAFIFFGQTLYTVGGDKFLTNLALVVMGRFRGGSAKVAIVSSTFFGTVSGSAVSNVVVDGAITIPMMKRTGYPPHLAAAVEAVASNGGQIMPPVMGAAAFLIAEFLNIPYGQVALAALAPALLYYLALFVQVDLEAAKHGLAGLPRAQVPRFRDVMHRGWVFVIPLGLLVYTLMFASWPAGKAGIAAVVVTFLVGALQRETRPTLRGIFTSIEQTGRTLLDLVAITALAGLVIGALQLSGFTAKLPMVLTTVAGNDAFLLLVLAAVLCVILGLSLPTTVVYVTLAVLVGPTLVQLGVQPLAAHLFLFYFGMLSLITPPVCLATYAAAAIAHSDFWRTGWTGMRLGIVAYIIPFVFATHPALLLKGSFDEILVAVATAAIGVILLGMALAGFLFGPLGWPSRIAAGLAGLLLIPPPTSAAWLTGNLVGLALGLAFVVWQWQANPLKRPRLANSKGGSS